MSKPPFFSILIPTKNRSHVVGFAIQSVLDQTFGDFEIIVSDNDDSETLTRDAVASFSDPRVKYYRTCGNLSMPDNWEFALSRSSGLYVTVLEDKRALYPNALEIISECALDRNAKVITWLVDILDDRYGRPIFMKHYGENRVTEKSSDELLQKYITGIIGNRTELPRLINSCIRRDIIDFIKQETCLNRFFIEVSPDLCAAFLQLNYVDYVTHIDSSLCISGALSLSPGHKIGRSEQNRRFISDIGDREKFYSHVPIKSCYIIGNGVLNDYLRLRELLGGRLARFTIAPRVYIMMCFAFIVRNFFSGGVFKDEFGLWKKHFYAQPLSIRKGLWISFIKIVLKEHRMHFLRKRPKLWNFISGLRGSKTKRFTGYNNVIDVIKDRRFLPRILIDSFRGNQ